MFRPLACHSICLPNDVSLESRRPRYLKQSTFSSNLELDSWNSPSPRSLGCQAASIDSLPGSELDGTVTGHLHRAQPDHHPTRAVMPDRQYTLKRVAGPELTPAVLQTTQLCAEILHH